MTRRRALQEGGPSGAPLVRTRAALAAVGPSRRTLLSALLIAGAFPPWDLDFLVWIALIPWMRCVSESETFARAVLQGFWLSVGVALLAAYWLALAMREFLALSWPVAILGLFVYAATVAQPQFLVFAPLFRAGVRRVRTQSSDAYALCGCLALALLYAGLDWALPRLFDVGLGYSLHAAPNLRQIADLGGVDLITCLIVLVNLLLWQLTEFRFGYTAGPEHPGRVGGKAAPLLRAGLVVALLGSASVYGELRNRQLAESDAESTRIVRVGLVQGSVPNDVRLAWAAGDDRAAERQLSTYMLLTEELIGQPIPPELVIWPETTFPGVFRQPGSKLQRGRGVKFDRQILKMRAPIVFGAYDMTEEGGRRTLFNTLFSITPKYDRVGGMGVVQRYHKRELLAFAEYLPGLSRSDWLRQKLPSLGFFGRGPGAMTLPILLSDGRSVQLGPIICSEALYPQHVIDTARKGSELILNVGSDGWFGAYGEPEFHLAISKFRSIETRLPQARAANSGISALILPTGEVTQRSQLGEQRIMNLDVPLGRLQSTLMLEWGEWFGPTALFLGSALALLLGLIHRRSES